MFIKYLENGLALIPLVTGEKRPAIPGWQEFCERLPTEVEALLWDSSNYVSYGVTLGPANNLLAIDIDSDDVKVLNAVKPSPVRKRGRKGETRFFKFNPEITSHKVAGCIDILSTGRQTVLPPSIHPDTKEPYVWITTDTIENFSVNDLPEFSTDDLEAIRSTLEPSSVEIKNSFIDLSGPFYNEDPKRGCPHGSQDRLKTICNALISRGASPDEAIRELLRYDEDSHFPIGYFKDKTRPDCFADPVSNATHFYASNLKSFNTRVARSGGLPVVPSVSGAEMLDVSELNQQVEPEKVFKEEIWPEPDGLLKDIRDLIAKLSTRHQPGLAIGGAIAIGSVLIANRLRLGDVWPNVYILNIAQTGAGKSFPYTVAKRLLSPESGVDLIGAGGYRSSSAILKDLSTRRERLDLIDECSGIFKVIRDGGVFQQDMLDILNALWSESHSIFLGPESVGRERVSVWNPCISSLFSTTPSGLKASISKEFITQGFLPRCLIFNDVGYGNLKEEDSDSFWDDELANKIIGNFDRLQSFGGLKEGQKRNLMAPKAIPDEIAINTIAKEKLRRYARDCSVRLANPDCGESEKHFLSRAAQQSQKLSLIHAALRFGEVETRDVDWAIDTLLACWKNASTLLPHVGAENAQEANVVRLLSLIRMSGQISQSELIQKTRFLRTTERNEILASLEADGSVKRVQVQTKTKPNTAWRLA